MIKECGWPSGPLGSDGHCGAQTVVVYLVSAADTPVNGVDDETHPVALGLCVDHDPAHERTHDMNEDESGARYGNVFQTKSGMVLNPDEVEIITDPDGNILGYALNPDENRPTGDTP